MQPQISLFLELFLKLDKKIKSDYTDSYNTFNHFRGAIILKIQLLELIKFRFLASQTQINQCFREMEQRGAEFTLSPDPIILKEASEFSNRFDLARRSLKLDIESFLVFSRVVLDYIPWMFQPYLKGYVASQEPATYDFRQFCEWFQDNPNLVKDREFREFLLNFYSWFMTNLRNPRNDLVIHLKRKYTLDKFSVDGKILRMKHSPWAGPGDEPESEF